LSTGRKEGKERMKEIMTEIMNERTKKRETEGGMVWKPTKINRINRLKL
jgi:hypothetical protein